MTSTSSTSDSWYLPAAEYYVPPAEADAYPVRQGDLFPAGLPDIEDWAACQLVHPTCELPKSSVMDVQVIRVEPIAERINDQKQGAAVVAGFVEKDGAFRVAQASTFFLPPYAEDQPPMFSNFREVETVPREHFTVKRRLAALTHEARVTFIRREIYFRYRIALTYNVVRDLEAQRIGNDSAFKGPRPTWAPSSTDS
jgi:hypothetical protein